MSAAGIILLLGLAPSGEQPRYTCRDPIVQQEMNYCAYQDFLKADTELNAQWRTALGAIRGDVEHKREGDERPSREAMLREAQRAWVTFRDAHCTVHGYWARGGSMEPMLFEHCRAELTRERTQQLKNMWTDD